VFISDRLPTQLTKEKKAITVTVCFVVGYVLHISILLDHFQRNPILVNTVDICIAFAWFLPEDDPVESKDVVGADASLTFTISS
jgi:hypothetical protein